MNLQSGAKEAHWLRIEGFEEQQWFIHYKKRSREELAQLNKKNIYSLYPPYCERLSVQKARTLSPLLFNMILEVLVSAIRQEKEKKKKWIKERKKGQIKERKKKKLSLFQ